MSLDDDAMLVMFPLLVMLNVLLAVTAAAGAVLLVCACDHLPHSHTCVGLSAVWPETTVLAGSETCAHVGDATGDCSQTKCHGETGLLQEEWGAGGLILV